MKVSVVVFAAGKGTRMKSELPKVLHKVGGIPMILMTLAILKKAEFKDITVIVGYKKNQVKMKIRSKFKRIKFIEQKTAEGTGGALKAFWSRVNNKPDYLVAMNGDDSFFYNPETIVWLLNRHISNGRGMSVLTCKLDREFNHRKVFRDGNGNFKFLTKDPSQKGEIICGLYVFSKDYLNKNIYRLEKRMDAGEYRIFDFMYLKPNDSIGAYKLENTDEWYGVNTKKDLENANKLLKDMEKNYVS